MNCAYLHSVHHTTENNDIGTTKTACNILIFVAASTGGCTKKFWAFRNDATEAFWMLFCDECIRCSTPNAKDTETVLHALRECLSYDRFWYGKVTVNIWEACLSALFCLFPLHYYRFWIFIKKYIQDFKKWCWQHLNVHRTTSGVFNAPLNALSAFWDVFEPLLLVAKNEVLAVSLYVKGPFITADNKYWLKEFSVKKNGNKQQPAKWAPYIFGSKVAFWQYLVCSGIVNLQST